MSGFEAVFLLEWNGDGFNVTFKFASPLNTDKHFTNAGHNID